jgi:hypothetical protein
MLALVATQPIQTSTFLPAKPSCSVAPMWMNGQQGVSAANNPAIAPDAKGIAFDTVDQYLVPASQLNGGNTQIYLRK